MDKFDVMRFLCVQLQVTRWVLKPALKNTCTSYYADCNFYVFFLLLSMIITLYIYIYKIIYNTNYNNWIFKDFRSIPHSSCDCVKKLCSKTQNLIKINYKQRNLLCFFLAKYQTKCSVLIFFLKIFLVILKI